VPSPAPRAALLVPRVFLAEVFIDIPFGTINTYAPFRLPHGANQNFSLEVSAMTSGFSRSLTLTFVFLAAGFAKAGTWKTIDVPGSIYTVVSGINQNSDLVGNFVDESGTQHGFLFSDGTFETIDPAGSIETLASGINDNRKVVGEYYETGFIGHGFLFDGVNYTTLDFPGATQTTAGGINNAGFVVGGYIDAQGKAHGFEWQNGSFTTVDVPGAAGTFSFGINNRNFISGTYQILRRSRLENHAYVLNSTGGFRDIGAKLSANGINDSKVVVGSGGSGRSKVYGYRFALKTKVFRRMRFPGMPFTWCYGINNKLEIVGFYDDLDASRHGFIWEK
jgi:probable HAF family extracellular repeat protein